MEDIRETRTELEDVCQQALAFEELYGLLRGTLDSKTTAKVSDSVQQLTRSLSDSHNDFSKNHRQVPLIRSIDESLKNLSRDISASWKLYAFDTLKPAFDLFNILKNLPEFKSTQDSLVALKNRLEYFQSQVPKSEKELLEFDQTATQFSQALTSIPGLTPKIQGFLTKIMEHSATLADLDEETLTWCGKPGRSKAFMITFKS